MRNIKLVLEYDGAPFSGFQKQPDRPSVQEALENALSRFFNRRMKIGAASGRTDAGAHATCQVVNFKIKSSRDLAQIQRGLNAFLPPAIGVKEISEVPEDFHARYSVQSKTYEYWIWNHPIRSPLLAGRVYHVPYRLNLVRMRLASKLLIGRRDFKSFCASGSKAGERGNTFRTIERLEIKKEGALLKLKIQADGFLYHMVRNIVGTLNDVGRGRLKPSDVREIIEKKDRRYAGAIAPPQGLFLLQVKYDN